MFCILFFHLFECVVCVCVIAARPVAIFKFLSSLSLISFSPSCNFSSFQFDLTRLYWKLFYFYSPLNLDELSKIVEEKSGAAINLLLILSLCCVQFQSWVVFIPWCCAMSVPIQNVSFCNRRSSICPLLSILSKIINFMWPSDICS